MDTNIIEGSGTATGTNTYAVTLSVKVAGLKTNGFYLVTFANANTAAATLNINGIGIKTIKNDQGNALISGSIKANIPYQLYFNGTDFIVMGTTGGIYSNSGSLAGNTTVTMGTNNLQFNSTGVTGLLTIDATNDNVGIGTATPVASALLELVSTTQGFLPPRGTATQRDAIVSPATGLMFYDTVDNDIDYFNGTAWRSLVDAPAASLTAGSVIFATGNNSVTDDNDNFFWDDTNNRLGIANGAGNSPQYRLDVGNSSYFSINGNFAHIVQHNSAASTFWSIAPRNGGDLDIAVTTTDPRPTSNTIASSDNALSIKANKDVDCLGSVTALNLKAHALIENRNPATSTTSTTFVTLQSASSVTFSGRPLLCFVNVTMFPSVANLTVELAVQIDAGADAVAAQLLHNEVEHNTVQGAVIVTPTAGSHTLRVRWRISGGTGTLTLDANDQILLHAVEL